MAFPRILEYLRILDTTAQNPRNLGKGAFSFPGMSQSHHPKGGSHGETTWQSSVGLRGDAEGLDCALPTLPGSVHVQEGGGCVRGGKGSGNGRSILGSLWHRSGDRHRGKSDVRDGVSSQGVCRICSYPSSGGWKGGTGVAVPRGAG